MKIKFNKNKRKGVIVSDIFERKLREFETKKEAEYFLRNQFGIGRVHKIPNLPNDENI